MRLFVRVILMLSMLNMVLSARTASSSDGSNCGPSTGPHDDCVCNGIMGTSQTPMINLCSSGSLSGFCFIVNNCLDATDPEFEEPPLRVGVNQEFNSPPVTVDGNYDTLVHSINKYSVYFNFEMHSDSGKTSYMFADLRKNSGRVKFQRWTLDTTLRTWPDPKLRDSSGSEDFKVVTGDTISFYRQLTWRSAITGEQTIDNYYSNDTLDFAVELVRVSDNTRIALLDSIGTLRQIPSGVPNLYGTRPILAIVKYVIPSTYNNDTLRVRVLPYSRGDGPHFFIRQDKWGIDIRGKMNATGLSAYLNDFGGGLGKRVLHQDLENAERESKIDQIMTVSPNPSSGKFTVIVEKALIEEPSIEIYDLTGRFYRVPASNLMQRGLQLSKTYHFSESGTYFVVLFSKGKLVGSKKVQVAL